MKHALTLLCLIALLLSRSSFAQEEPGPEAAAFLERVAALDREGKTEEALKLLDQGLGIYKEPNYDRFFTLNYKFTLLSRLNRFEDAVAVAEEKAGIIQSPKQALCVADSYLKVNNPDTALEWIGKSVDRGLQSYTIFNAEIYEPLRGRQQFISYVDTVKRRNGLGLPAPAFRRESVAGNRMDLGRYEGKVVLLDFWATFCGPCIKEMPHLKRCYEKHRERGFEIVGFSLDQDQSRLTTYIEKNGIPWEIVFCQKGEADETVRLYKVVNIPASFLVDRNGIVRHVNLAGSDLEKAIEELLAQH